MHTGGVIEQERVREGGGGIAYTHTERICMCRRMYEADGGWDGGERERTTYQIHTEIFFPQNKTLILSSTEDRTTGLQCAPVPMTN